MNTNIAFTPGNNIAFNGKVPSKIMRKIADEAGDKTAEKVIPEMQQMGNNNVIWGWKSPSSLFGRRWTELKQTLHTSKFKVSTNDVISDKFGSIVTNSESAMIIGSSLDKTGINSISIENCRRIIQKAAIKGQSEETIKELRETFGSNKEVLEFLDTYK